MRIKDRLGGGVALIKRNDRKFLILQITLNISSLLITFTVFFHNVSFRIFWQWAMVILILVTINLAWCVAGPSKTLT